MAPRSTGRSELIVAKVADGPLNQHPGECWRWVYRGADAHPHPGTVEPCRAPVRWMGFAAAFGSPRFGSTPARSTRTAGNTPAGEPTLGKHGLDLPRRPGRRLDDIVE